MVAAHIFRQTRSRVIAVTGVIFVLLFYRKQYKALVLVAVFGVISFGIVQLMLPENILVELYATPFENIHLVRKNST